MARVFGTYQCCTDCLLYLANGDVPEDRPELPDEIAAQWPGTKFNLVPGDSEHDNEFSWSSCDACGSNLGGARHEFHVLVCETA